jgi:hypothetical protein
MSKCKRMGSRRVSSHGNILREADKCKKDFDRKKETQVNSYRNFHLYWIFNSFIELH